MVKIFMKKKFAIKEITITALMAAVICVLAPFSIPIGAIPISLATFAVYLTSAVSGWKKGTVAVIVYIALGAVGVPVFSGFEGGFQKIIGVTGGYIIGYIPCAFIIGFLTEKFKNKKAVFPLSMIAGTIFCYAVGTAWFMLQTHTGFVASLSMCVVPFLIFDAIKIICSSLIGIPLNKLLQKIENQNN